MLSYLLFLGEIMEATEYLPRYLLTIGVEGENLEYSQWGQIDIPSASHNTGKFRRSVWISKAN